MYTVKLMNIKYDICREIPCQDLATALKVVKDLDSKIYIIALDRVSPKEWYEIQDKKRREETEISSLIQ